MRAATESPLTLRVLSHRRSAADAGVPAKVAMAKPDSAGALRSASVCSHATFYVAVAADEARRADLRALTRSRAAAVEKNPITDGAKARPARGLAVSRPVGDRLQAVDQPSDHRRIGAAASR